MTGLIATLLIHFNVWTHADIIRVGNRPELIISTIAASLAVLTSLIGWSGILLNNRAFLAVYSFLLWICFALLVTPGYITYKKRTFNLEGKVNAQWSRDLGLDGRLRVQNQLHCCGYFNPFVEATVSQTCYARSLLPGCKGPYIQFERLILERWYTAVFAVVPAQLAIMVAALLCSNHVTYRFGKGMMPKAYRLNMNSMAVIMDNYAKCVFLCSLFSCEWLTDRGWGRRAVSWRNSTGTTWRRRSSRARARTSSSTPCRTCRTTRAPPHRMPAAVAAASTTTSGASNKQYPPM